MQKFFTLILLIPFVVSAQNVGIGTNSPQERLDVNGNINVNGTIKANGVAGMPGQVLTTNSAGNLQWNNGAQADNGYKNFIGFYGFFDSVENWTIPNGVTRILVEAWGGGGGGSFGGGGGGGGYVRSQFTVNPGTVLNITIGSAGAGSANGSTEAGRPGGNTIVRVPDNNGTTWYAVATGGTGAYNNPNLSFISSHNVGGSFYVTNQYPIGVGVTIYPYFMGEVGEVGYPNYYTYTQVSTGVFIQEATGGKGGDAGSSNKTGGAGSRKFNDNTSTLSSRYAGSGGSFGGGGGSGMPDVAAGRPGGKGKVIIWY